MEEPYYGYFNTFTCLAVPVKRDNKSFPLFSNLLFSFAVTSATADGLLENFASLNDAIENNRIFIVNHSVLDDIMDINCNQIVRQNLFFADNFFLTPVSFHTNLFAVLNIFYTKVGIS